MPKDSSKTSVDAIALLKKDHRAVEQLFKKFEKAKGSGAKATIAKQICMDLSVHTIIEEELLYPEVDGNIDEELVDEAYVEHDGAKVLIAELLAGSPDEPFYDAKVTVLSEEIKHHVKEEERPGGLFAQSRKSGVDLKDLGRKLKLRQSELKATFSRDGIPTPATRTMTGARVVREKPLK